MSAAARQGPDFDRRLIVIGEAKGNKIRVSMLPTAIEGASRRQLEYARSLWTMDRVAQRPCIETPP